MIVRLFFVFILIYNSSFALDNDQIRIKKIAKETALEYCLPDLCFDKSLQAITWQESSFGKHLIGDAKGIKYYYKHHDKKYYIPKSLVFKENGTLYYWYKPIKIKFRKRVYKEIDWKPLNNSSLGAFQIKLETAKYVIIKRELYKYKHLLYNDEKLILKLLNEPKFSAVIAVNYLVLNYKIAKQRNYNYPWFYAISRYNGGTRNFSYVNKIKRKIQKMN